MKATIDGRKYKQVKSLVTQTCLDCDIYKDSSGYFPACQYLTLSGNAPQEGITRNGQEPKVIADYCAEKLTHLWKREDNNEQH